ncbi:hypothetical protein P296_05760 [Salmonella enterica subsp. arizonae serovar 18:z4,z23:- str. CVM N26624]|uniref:Uncharacterized protein n=2 Tax=Salmonella enterica subsp. arizonae TaxID=59203 RepID=A9ML78_SALAR|nr:hypothetical protein SARI_02385 [Salmonella enterica subsp. arizonae serovar 62:z4,z23:-]AIP97633.1 hypothetical protein N898_11395 [Salmonella enterica subsp. arizonae serovar 62:z36:- str. RKS2983]OLV92908.1 hypothetical protein P296_05760 [Salmonella enterica subsp. arizonae serovar 18:z4,z23:- str. CVM N26624]OLV99405.1 hypothetical protein P297_15450 [Salmonella enterica subsp. arizonae serovar 18:z4,z23:- str. CVM N26625]OLW05094.1 hypothetical protein P298_04805 [Salmonella enterica s
MILANTNETVKNYKFFIIQFKQTTIIQRLNKRIDYEKELFSPSDNDYLHLYFFCLREYQRLQSYDLESSGIFSIYRK